MDYLLVPIVGPMQSWGTRSRFRNRDTEREPTKSGVVGLLCNVLGRERDDPIDDVTRIVMGVRVDREGLVRREFQTAEHVLKASGAVDKNPQISQREYLTDAAFLVALEGERELLRMLYEALLRPVRPPYLGRKSFVPSVPLALPKDRALVEATDIQTALTRFEPLFDNLGYSPGGPEELVRLVLPDDGSAGEARIDEPINFSIYGREYQRRFVRTEFVPRGAIAGEAAHVSQ